MTIQYRYVGGYDEDEEVLNLPSKRIVCPRCDGRGVHDCWEGGMTGDEMAEQGPEFFEDYRSGMYDKRCDECHGRNVVEVVDRSRCSKEQLRKYDSQEGELASMEAQQRQECWAEECFERSLMGLGPDWS